MQRTNTPATYGVVSRAFHWAIGLSMIAMLTLGLLLDDLGSFKMSGFFIHKSLGMTILALAALRYLWNWTQPSPGFPPDEPLVNRMAAAMTHGLLYAGMFLMPITGYLMSTTGGHPVNVWGLGTLPVLAQPDAATGLKMSEFYFGLHEKIAYGLIFLVGLHAIAALGYHFLYRRDDVLPRMLPSVRHFTTRVA